MTPLAWRALMVPVTCLILVGAFLAGATRHPTPATVTTAAASSCSPYVTGETDTGNAFPTTTHAVVSTYRSYWNLANAVAAVDHAATDVAHGDVPILSFKLPAGVSWAQAANGAVDGQAGALAGRLDALGTRVYVAFHHEPEGDGVIADWTGMQAHLAPIFNRGDLRYTIIVTGYDQLYGTDAAYRLDSLWPAGAPVKALGVDVYQSYKKTGDRWTNLRTAYWDKVSAWAQMHGVEWGVAETGLTDNAYTQTVTGKTWFTDNLLWVQEAGGTFWAYFNVKGTTVANTWPLGVGAKEAAYLAALQ